MMGSYKLLLCLLTPIIFIACTDSPDFEETPSLTYLGLSNNDLAQSVSPDTVIIHLEVTDADGDIGGQDGTQGSIYMIDQFDGYELAPFKLPRIDQNGAGNGIKANIQLKFIVNGDLCCRYPDGSGGCIPSTQYPLDSFFYETYIIDRAGHESNRVVVGPIYLTCD